MYKRFLVELAEAKKVSDFDFQDAYKTVICSDSTGEKDCQSCLLAKNCIHFFLFNDASPRVSIKNAGEETLLLAVEEGKAMEFFPYHIYGIEAIAGVKVKTVQELRTVYKEKILFPFAEDVLSQKEKEASDLADEVNRLKNILKNLKNMEDQASELAEIFKKKVEEYHISSELEASELKLAMANLKLAVSEAVKNLADTKGIFKSRRIAQIRQVLESAIK